jgi:hypothetical protein
MGTGFLQVGGAAAGSASNCLSVSATHYQPQTLRRLGVGTLLQDWPNDCRM